MEEYINKIANEYAMKHCPETPEASRMSFVAGYIRAMKTFQADCSEK